MADDIGFLTPRALELGPQPVQLLGPIGRIGDSIVYHGRQDVRALRVREYAPYGIVRRVEGGELVPADPAFAAAWAAGVQRFLDQADRLRALPPGSATPLIFVAAPHPAGREHGAFLVTAPMPETLEATLADGFAPSLGEVELLARRLAAALAEVHAHDLVHLDIAPETVAVAGDSVLLSDFGVDDRAFMQLLGDGEPFVRPGYAPLELYDATGSEPVGPRADVYAASAVIYRLLVGEAPPPSPARVTDPDLPLLDRHADEAPNLVAAMRQGLAVEPERRFATGQEWFAALASEPAVTSGDGSAGAAYPPIPKGQPIPPFQPPAAAPSRRRRGFAWPLILLLVLLAGALVFAFSRGWFEDGRDPEAETRPAAMEVPARPFRLGTTINESLGNGDRRWESGRYEDVYSFAGQGGRTIAISFATSAFEPRVTLTGPGNFGTRLQASGDRGETFQVRLPRSGTYYLAVSSEGPGEGAYTLGIREPDEQAAPQEVLPPVPETAPEPDPNAGNAQAPAPQPAEQQQPQQPAQPGPEPETRPQPQPAEEEPTPAPARQRSLSGTWRGPGDPNCRRPARNAMASAEIGGRLTSSVGGVTYVHRIVAVNGSRVETILLNTERAGRRFVFTLSGNGGSYSIAGETWVRCG